MTSRDKPEYRVIRYWQRGDDILLWDEIIHWCIDTYGLPGPRWGCNKSTQNYGTFYFNDAQDASLFSLRWV
jgi:hypothetical protein